MTSIAYTSRIAGSIGSGRVTFVIRSCRDPGARAIGPSGLTGGARLTVVGSASAASGIATKSVYAMPTNAVRGFIANGAVA